MRQTTGQRLLPRRHWDRLGRLGDARLAFIVVTASLFGMLLSWRRAAVFVDRLLRGAQPEDLPVEQPKHFDLVVNLRTARRLGVTVPQSILLGASEVIR